MKISNEKKLSALQNANIALLKSHENMKIMGIANDLRFLGEFKKFKKKYFFTFKI